MKKIKNPITAMDRLNNLMVDNYLKAKRHENNKPSLFWVVDSRERGREIFKTQILLMI